MERLNSLAIIGNTILYRNQFQQSRPDVVYGF
jgi:hypothetical protein